LSTIVERSEQLRQSHCAPDQFHLSISSRDICTTSSTLQLPVHVVLPSAYKTSDSFLQSTHCRWRISRVSPDDGHLTAVWLSSNAIPLSRLNLVTDHEIETTLACSRLSHQLLVVQLVLSTNDRHVLASAFFNPLSMMNRGPTCLGSDPIHALDLFQQIIAAL
jgi:hypothetical protein